MARTSPSGTALSIAASAGVVFAVIQTWTTYARLSLHSAELLAFGFATGILTFVVFGFIAAGITRVGRPPSMTACRRESTI